MKWELDDNARSGFHYLVLGVLVVGVLAFLNWGLGMLYPGIGPGGAFSHGYLVSDEGTNLIVSSTARGERLATAVLLASCSALLFVASAWALGLVMGKMEPRTLRWIAKVSFMLTLLGLGYSALSLPPRELIGHRDGAFIIWQRTILLNDLTIPGSKRIELIPFYQIGDVRCATTQGTLQDGVDIELIMNDGRTIPIGHATDHFDDDLDVTRFAVDRASLLRTLLETP
jgi:hypothetical protein